MNRPEMLHMGEIAVKQHCIISDDRVKNQKELRTARLIQSVLGTYVAAIYMHRQQWSVESALWWLLGKAAR